MPKKEEKKNSEFKLEIEEDPKPEVIPNKVYEVNGVKGRCQKHPWGGSLKFRGVQTNAMIFRVGTDHVHDF